MKKTNITLSIALAAVFSSSVAFAEAEVTGKIVHESAVFSDRGNTIGSWANSAETGDIQHGKGALMKSETSARIYIDGELDEVNEGVTYHVEINLMHDTEGVDKYDGNESYTQRDALREAYVDTETNGYSIRAGKQQVVWGTADGMKLLDVINPTDYSEMAQNQMEDSRIPVWMLNAETDTADGGSMQFIISEAKTHKIAGLGIASGSARSHTNGNAGNAFIMKGVDSITGKVHGFVNIAPALGQVAGFFTAAGSGVGDTTGHAVGLRNNYKGATVSEFVGNGADGADFAGLNVVGCKASLTAGLSVNSSSAHCLYNTANLTLTNSGFTGREMGSNQDVTNLIDADSADDTGLNWDTDNPNSMFEYMGETAFASFFSFSEMKSKYVVDHTEDSPNFGGRYKNVKDGVNYSFNFLSHEDANPYIDISYEKESDGSALTTKYNAFTDGGTCGNQAPCTVEAGTWLTLQSGGTDWAPTETDVAVLKFVEKTNRIETLGASFDTAVETAQLGPVVLRGEFTYDVGVMTPIVDRARLNIGDAVGALTSQKGDRFSYVLGADITALTNMMVSAQIIQIRNLDYVDITHTPSDSTGEASHVAGARYTGDMATMHLTNGLKKAEENKEFYSFFLSKPFGASGEHRWNNIFMFEENGGKWNRLDAEFSIDDDTQFTAEYNKYFGDENTQFGQLAASSNIQVGVKYSF
jgi:hypothetical protein